MAGYFTSPTADFGANFLTNAGSSDGFVAKLTDAGNTGNFVWSQQVNSAYDERATALAVSGTNVYVAGHFTSPTLSFGTTILTNANTNISYEDVFIAKLTDAGSTGSFVWAQRAGGMGGDYASALAVSGVNVYVAGNFSSPTADFGPTTLTSAGSSDVFVAKLTDVGSTGSFVWAQRAGGTGGDGANALTVSGTSVYVAGGFSRPTAGFGPTTLTSAGSSDVFVAKLTDVGSTGSFVWAQRAGGTGGDYASALVVSGVNVYVAGDFSSPTADFGSTTLTNAGYRNLFVAKITDVGSTGSFTWVQRAGGTNGDSAYGLAVSGTSVYVTGELRSFRPTFGAITLSNPSGRLGFLAALTDPTLTATTTAAGSREPAALFPNPARRMATLRLTAGTTPAPLTLTDALGRAVRRYPAPAGAEAVLDLQGLPAGLYLLRGAGPAQRLVVE